MNVPLPDPAGGDASVIDLTERLQHGVRVDRELGRDLLDRGQPVAGRASPSQTACSIGPTSRTYGRTPDGSSTRISIIDAPATAADGSRRGWIHRHRGGV
jgi:hypothetical protein